VPPGAEQASAGPSSPREEEEEEETKRVSQWSTESSVGHECGVTGALSAAQVTL
jgi:hypothetical protein